VSRPGVKRMGIAHGWLTHIKTAFDQANAAAKRKDDRLIETKYVDDM
jgi:hypothetical protein